MQKHQHVYLPASKVEKRREEVGGNIRGHTVPLLISQEFMAEDHGYSMVDKRTSDIYLANYGKDIIWNPAQKGFCRAIVVHFRQIGVSMTTIQEIENSAKCNYKPNLD